MVFRAPLTELDERLARHRRVAATLAGHDDARLADLVGTGGATTRIEVDGVAVFVKRLPLTDRERRPDAIGSTANLFGLPAACHWGVGSPGFGAWRELAMTTTTSGWVLARHSERFPLLHHARVLPGAAPLAAEYADVDAVVAYWGGSAAMRDRLDALATASASVVLFLEHLPETVTTWLARQDEEGLVAAVALLEAELPAAVATMADHGVQHFDAHFDNLLTDGRRVYVADLGLATSPDLRLSRDEMALVEHTRTHDVGHVLAGLVNALVAAGGGPRDPVARHRFVRACAAGADPGLRPAVADTVRRYAPLAAVVNAFYAELFTVRRDAAYPAQAVARELSRLPVPH